MSGTGANKRETEPARLFDSLFETHHDAVYRYCLRRLGPSDAEDAAADVFAIVWRRIDQVPAGDATRAWLIGVAYKVVGNRFRSQRRRSRLSQRIESEQRAQLGEVQSEPDTQSVLAALEELSPSDRELVRLSSWDGLTRSEIAVVLGIRVNAVDQRLHRARARLKTHFDRLAEGRQTTRPEEASI